MTKSTKKASTAAVDDSLRAVPSHERPADPLARAAHDLRAPIHTLDGLLELLAHSALDGEQRRYLALSNEALASLRDVVDEHLGPPSAITPVAPSPARGPRVLVVDDDDANLMYASMVMQEAGAVVVVERDADRVVSLVAQREPFSLVLIDLQMPGIGGLELLRQLKRTPAMTSTPLVVLSGTSDPVAQQAAIAAGAVACVLKPASPTTLAAVLHRYGSSPTSTHPPSAAVADLAARRPTVVAAIAADDVRALALVVGAIRVGHPQLAQRLEGRLARRELPGLLIDLDDEIRAGALDELPSAMSAAATTLFRATAQREHERLHALFSSTSSAMAAQAQRTGKKKPATSATSASTASAPLRVLVKQMSHRLAGSAATFGHADVGELARAVSSALPAAATDDDVLALAQRLLTALDSVNPTPVDDLTAHRFGGNTK